MPQDLIDNKSTLVHVMAWCRQTTSHYLDQCWPSSPTPYGIIRPQWVYKIKPGTTRVKQFVTISKQWQPEWHHSENSGLVAGPPNECCKLHVWQLKFPRKMLRCSLSVDKTDDRRNQDSCHTWRDHMQAGKISIHEVLSLTHWSSINTTGIFTPWGLVTYQIHMGHVSGNGLSTVPEAPFTNMV